MQPKTPWRPFWTLTATTLLGLVLVGLAWVGSSSDWDVSAGLLFSGLYLLLAAAVVLGARWLAGGHAGRFLAAGGLALVLWWQLRETTRWPEGFGALALGLLLSSLLLLPLCRHLAEERAGWRDLWWALTLGAGVAVVALGVLQSAGPWGWHLLRHNTLLGTPAYYLSGSSVAEARHALFARHGAEGQVAVSTQAAVSIHADGAEAALDAQPRPHVVFVLLDTLRADALSDWGGSGESMPRLEARLEQARRYTDLWSAATWTRPAMASFFTGLQPEAHGARGIEDGLAREHTTLAERLHGLGYATTALVTNWAAVGAEVGFDQGFDTFREFRATPYARAETVGRAVEAWLDQPSTQLTTQPQFLYLHYLDPHEPYLAGVTPRRPTAREMWRAYRAELAYLDVELDETLTRLEAALGESTLFVLLSDHGEEFYEHELFGHGFSLYDEVLRVPLAVWGAGVEPAVDAARLEGRDVHDLVQVLAEEGPDGLAEWSQRRHRTRRYASIYYSSEGRLLLRPYIAEVAMRAVEEEGRKLIWSAYGDSWELYDRQRDPGERRNRIAELDSTPGERVAGLDALVEAWRPGTPLELSEEALEQLEALGYIDR